MSKSFNIKTNLSKQLNGVAQTRVSNNKWVIWGKRNDYPDLLSQVYYNSPTLKSCVDFAVTSIIGDGVDYEASNFNPKEMMPSYESTWSSFIRDLALDYVLYGSFAFQIIKNKDGKTYSYYHQPMSTVRCGERDEDGQITHYYICQDWSKTGLYPPIEIPRFGFVDGQKITDKKPYLFVYEHYSPSIDYYTIPRYIGAIKAAQTEAEHIKFDLNCAVNGFTSKGVLVVPEMETEEEKQEVLQNIQNSFTGANGAASVITMFSNGTEGNLPQFVAFGTSNNEIDLYDSANERTIDRIVSAFRIPSKALIGYPLEGASLGGSGNTMAVAYKIYNQLVGNDDRNVIIETINKMFALNGIETEIVLKPLKFDISTEENINVTEDDDSNVETVDDENVSEKITSITE